MMDVKNSEGFTLGHEWVQGFILNFIRVHVFCLIVCFAKLETTDL